MSRKIKKQEKVVVSIESKVDETFGQTIGTYLRAIERRIQNGEVTNAGFRIEQLKEAFFPTIGQTVFESLRYQLLTAIAGTLAEAKNQQAKKAIFLVQTFVSSNMDSKKHRQNHRDLDHFLEVISNGYHRIIHDNDLLDLSNSTEIHSFRMMLNCGLGSIRLKFKEKLLIRISTGAI